MPYEVRKEEDGRWCVFSKDSGESKGCSDSEEEAQEHMQALYAQEEKSLEPEYAERSEVLTLKERLQTLWDKIFPKPLPKTGFYTIKQADGAYRWVGVSATAFLDRENEIIPVEALETVKSLVEGDLGPLQYWHLPVDLGSTDLRLADGVCLVESGLWADTPVAQAVRKDVDARPEHYGMSIGFYADAAPLENVTVKGRTVKRVWPRITQKERSLLPKQFAANAYTYFITEGGTPVDDTKRKALEDLLGTEMAATVIGQVDALNQKALEKDAVVKEADLPAAEPTSAPETPPATVVLPESKEFPSISHEELTKALQALEGLPAQIAELRKELDTLKAEQAPRISDLLRPSQAKETVATETEAQQAGPVAPSAIDQIANKMLGLA